MRTTFIEGLMKASEEDPNLWLLTGDLGYSFLEGFFERFPNRSVNVGIAEQNMMSIAAGLALVGKKVVVYSIVNFATFRCLEQIRNDICYHNLDVTIVGVGAGYAYGSQGYSHHGIEDIAIMRVLPNMKIFAPAEVEQTEWMMRNLFSIKGPSYLRLGKNSLRIKQELPQGIGQAIFFKEGKDLFILCLGTALSYGLEVAVLLEKKKISAGVISFPQIVPIDEEAIIKVALQMKMLVVIEEHRVGGLSTILAEVLMERKISVPVKVFNLPDEPIKVGGSSEELCEHAGIRSEAMVVKILKELL
jgi:transketolase